MLVALLALSAHATSLSLRSEESVDTGVTLRTYRAASPSTDIYVLVVDLCADGVYLDASRASDSTRSTGSWADDEDLTAATNGDFYKTDPLRVYGDAFGGGVRWPLDQTGLDEAYAGEWYYEHAGWIAFRHDGLEFSHTGWVKENASSLGITEGWANDDLRPDPPVGTLELVSGFPELVVEGRAMTCADPEASDCFPDRSDMRDRNPRTAMGFTEDRATFFLVVADGRTSDDDGLYGSELADVMAQLGAWEAFNLDGGGSSQLWTDGDYVNDIDGNNNGGGTRSVANHWGVYAGGRGWLPDRPGHCESAPGCGTMPSAGGEIDDDDACFRTLGPREYWREESDGYGGHLYWTNAYEAESPDNWAWWRLEMEAAGTYEVEVYVDATWSVFDDVEYEVRADGASTRLRRDPTGIDGWMSLGTFDFAAGGDQWVALYDDQDDAPGSNQHIAADAVRLTRIGGGDTGDSGDSRDSGDSGDSGDSDGVADSGLPTPGDATSTTGLGGCGCGTGGGSGGARVALALAAAALARRYRA